MTALIKKGTYWHFVPYFLYQKLVLTTICCLMLFSAAYSQGNVFSAEIITDINFSQIEGDLMAGFDRIGYGAGLGVSYAFVPQWAGHIELMYRNVGARSSHFSSVRRSIDIQQAQIPVYASYRTWWVNGLSKFHFDAGMVYARNVQSKINFPRFENNLTFIQDNDFSILAGFGLWLNHHHGIQGRYIRSMTALMKNPAEDLTWKLYYISLQYQYRF